MVQLLVNLSMKGQWRGIMVIYFGKIGKEQSYIARVEKGEADIQLSSFFRIARALGIEFTPTFIL